MQIKGRARMFKDELEYGIHEFYCSGCLVWTCSQNTSGRSSSRNIGGAKEVETWKTFAVILDQMTIFKPNPELGVSDSCGFFTSKPRFNKTRCLHAPLSKPTRSQTHLPALHPAAALSSAHPLLCTIHSGRNGPLHFHRSPVHHFQIRHIHRRTRSREWREERRRNIVAVMTLKTMCQTWTVCTATIFILYVT